LLFISLVTKEVIYIDPKGTSTDKADTVTKNVNMHLAKIKNFKNLKLKSKIVNHQLQTDDYNCGVFVCYFYATMIENKFPNFDIKIDIDDYRTHIKEIFKSNSYIKACCSCGKTLSIISNVFKNVKKFDCGHKFHISCINQCFNDCQVCESNHF
jgi:hypothetical protein